MLRPTQKVKPVKLRDVARTFLVIFFQEILHKNAKFINFFPKNIIFVQKPLEIIGFLFLTIYKVGIVGGKD